MVERDQSARMSREDILKIHTLELKVPIYCKGCLKKVKKVVQKIDGVYQSSVDVALGKVTISGLMDPETVLRKLQKARKPVRLWGEQPGVPLEVQLQKLRLGSGGSARQQHKDDGTKGQQQPKEAGGKEPQQHQAKDAGDNGQGQGQPQQQPKGRVGDGGVKKAKKKNGGPSAASLSGPMLGGVVPPHSAGMMMRQPNMMGGGGGAVYPGMGQMGGGGHLGGMPMVHPHMGGVGTHQVRGDAHGKPDGGMSMAHPHMGGFAHGMPPGGMPAPGFFLGGGGILLVRAEMTLMSQLSRHGHHHAHHGHNAHGGQVYPPPPESGYGYGRPAMPQYLPPGNYYAMPPQRHPHDNMFSDENPNDCSVM